MGRSIFDPQSRLFDPSVIQVMRSQICQLGSQLDAFRPVADVKLHAGMLLDTYFAPTDPYMTFLDLGEKVDF